jgi:hypothetical protein
MIVAFARSTVKRIGSPALRVTRAVTSLASSISLPSMAVIRSPERKPAAAAGDPVWTSATRAGCRARPISENITVKIRIARMKLAAGPPAVIRARCQTGLKWK